MAQLPVPAHPPLHPAKTEPASGEAWSVTTLPASKSALQVAPQKIANGELVTVPEPEPVLVTVSGNASRVNVAVTFREFHIAVIQTQFPQHPSPDHPAKVQPGSGIAVSVTTVP